MSHRLRTQFSEVDFPHMVLLWFSSGDTQVLPRCVVRPRLPLQAQSLGSCHEGSMDTYSSLRKPELEICVDAEKLTSGPEELGAAWTGQQSMGTSPADCGPVPVFIAQPHIRVSLASRLSDWGQATSRLGTPPVVGVEVVSRGLKANA